MINGGLSLIRETISGINPSEQKAAKYILENPQEVIRLSVQELAKRSDSSSSAIIRLCKNLGVDGFRELKLRIAGDLQTAANGGEEFKEVQPNDDIPTLIETITNNSMYSLKETAKVLDTHKIEQAVDALYKANRIDFYAAGASLLAALDGLHKFMRINKHCTAYMDSHMQLTSSVTLSERDVAVGISYSGETVHVIEAIKNAKKNGALTIGITKYGYSRLAKEVDIQLETISSESDMRSAATSSRIVQLNVIDILFIGAAGKNYDSSIEYLRKSRNAIQQSYRGK
ncbi:MurR/RpiR family transcriptional regulator [Peribacillus alkalitolerans]|uniref:MurR/RpiR family transcriptional regulator n=1 Tax=Peribacillus alkalitolerans TaxID=1550385 RepID=UPI0013D5BAD7|nr:MurR/RpiR family transcriptional regulator [Peribacillus alkalitolerans]